MTVVKKQLWFLARSGLPAVGFALVCVGAYIMSLHTDYNTLRVILGYITISCGFLATLIGVFWSICHSMKSKMYQRDQRGEHDRCAQVYTVERPSSYPPSYQESQRNQVRPERPSESVVVVDGVHMMINLAPPLYSQDSSEVPDCTWSWEQPPSYTEIQVQPVP
ncbi:hypothetical protein LDENG_00293900 [Lucifuga dentata]|nr:hypothetical protein LDENG_00293900 [Lucifuga dentata]